MGSIKIYPHFYQLHLKSITRVFFITAQIYDCDHHEYDRSINRYIQKEL